MVVRETRRKKHDAELRAKLKEGGMGGEVIEDVVHFEKEAGFQNPLSDADEDVKRQSESE